MRRGFAYAVCVALCRASSSSPSSSSSSSVSSHAQKKKWITLSSPSVPWTCHVLSGVFLMADGFGDCRARADSHSTAAGVARGHLECKVARDGVFCVCVCVISRGVARAATASASARPMGDGRHVGDTGRPWSVALSHDWSNQCLDCETPGSTCPGPFAPTPRRRRARAVRRRAATATTNGAKRRDARHASRRASRRSVGRSQEGAQTRGRARRPHTSLARVTRW